MYTCIYVCIDVGKLKQSNADLKAEIGMYVMTAVYYSALVYYLFTHFVHTLHPVPYTYCSIRH